MCKIYFTEDTPAILSKAGSNSNLSALSIESGPAPAPEVEPASVDAPDTSDSSNLSDAGDLLEECIQKGIAKVSSCDRLSIEIFYSANRAVYERLELKTVISLP